MNEPDFATLAARGLVSLERLTRELDLLAAGVSGPPELRGEMRRWTRRQQDLCRGLDRLLKRDELRRAGLKLEAELAGGLAETSLRLGTLRRRLALRTEAGRPLAALGAAAQEDALLGNLLGGGTSPLSLALIVQPIPARSATPQISHPATGSADS